MIHTTSCQRSGPHLYIAIVVESRDKGNMPAVICATVFEVYLQLYLISAYKRRYDSLDQGHMTHLIDINFTS